MTKRKFFKKTSAFESFYDGQIILAPHTTKKKFFSVFSVTNEAPQLIYNAKTFSHPSHKKILVPRYEVTS